MTSTRDQRDDDDVIVVTEDHIVPDETAADETGGLADEPGRHRAAGAERADAELADRGPDDTESASDEPDAAPAGDRRAFAMPGASAAAQERLADDGIAGEQVPAETVPDEDVADEDVADEELAGEGLAETAARAGGQQAGQSRTDPWPEIQARFVDDPRSAVEQAAEVTTGALSALTAAARNREQSLRGGWQAGNTGTEDLRTALRDYRDLAQRLSELAGQL